MARGLARADYPLPVAIQDPSEALKELDATLTSVEKVLDIPSMREEVTSLEAEASAPTGHQQNIIFINLTPAAVCCRF